MIRSIIFVLAFVLILGCGAPQPGPSGSPSPSNPTSWVETAEVGVSVLTVALPGAIATVQVLPIDPLVKAGIVDGLRAAQAGLPRLAAALERYRQSPTSDAVCEARAVVQLVADSLLAASASLASVGYQTPAEVLVSLGGLASLVDELLPRCSADGGGASYAAHVAEELARRPAGGLRTMPAVR